jgi:sRNA-binding regulator protein Hfq
LKNIFTAMLIVVSLLLLNTRPGICREQAQTVERALENSSQTQLQSNQNQGAASSSNAGQTTPVKLDDKARKVKRMVSKIGVAGRLTLYLRNGEELYGSVVSYDEESLQIAEIDLKQVVTVQYRNVKKVREDYGKRDLLTGKRTNPSKGIKIGVAVGLLFLIALPIIIVASSKD